MTGERLDQIEAEVNDCVRSLRSKDFDKFVVADMTLK